MLDLEWFGTLTDVTELTKQEEARRVNEQHRKLYLNLFWNGVHGGEGTKKVIQELLALVQAVIGSEAIALAMVEIEDNADSGSKGRIEGSGEVAEFGRTAMADERKESERRDVFLVAGVGIDAPRLGTALGRASDKSWFTGALLQSEDPYMFRGDVGISEGRGDRSDGRRLLCSALL